MFEYAIGHYQKHPPSRRLLLSWVISILSHTSAVLILYLYPQLLQGGMGEWFRQPVLTPSESQNQKWRSLTFVRSKMDLPPAEELKRLMYDWNQAKVKEGDQPPIHINLPSVNADELSKPLPKPQPDKPVPIGSPAASATGMSATGNPPPAAAIDSVPRIEPPVETKKAAPAGLPDGALNQIPKGAADASPPAAGGGTSGSGRASPPGSAGAGTKDVKDQGQEIRAQGGLFDTQGYNLDEYGKLIRSLVEQKWFIPSNLRNSQGSTTIVFYISKDGHFQNAHIEVGSGNGSLDIAALNAVVAADPFPPLPRGFPAVRVGARFVFAYNERR
jgi:TonB family protein